MPIILSAAPTRFSTYSAENLADSLLPAAEAVSADPRSSRAVSSVDIIVLIIVNYY